MFATNMSHKNKPRKGLRNRRIDRPEKEFITPACPQYYYSGGDHLHHRTMYYSTLTRIWSNEEQEKVLRSEKRNVIDTNREIPRNFPLVWLDVGKFQSLSHFRACSRQNHFCMRAGRDSGTSELFPGIGDLDTCDTHSGSNQSSNASSKLEIWLVGVCGERKQIW